MSDHPPPLNDLSASAKLVYKILEYRDEKLDQQQIAHQSRLPPRTVRDAIQQLRTAHIIEETVNPRDPRKKLYCLATDPPHRSNSSAEETIS